jgi:succinyl-CoA synthetase beta subunit
MDLYEFEGKAFLARLGVPCPSGIFAQSIESAGEAALAIGYPCVVKSQLLAARAAEAGGVVTVRDPTELERAARRLLALEIGDERPVGLLVEGLPPRGEELYAAVAFDSSCACPVLLFSRRGGTGVEGHAGTVLRMPVPVENLPGITPAWVAERLTDALPLVDVEDLGNTIEGVARLLANLLSAFSEHDLELIEVNPLIATPSGLIAADATVVVDDAALFRQTESLAQVKRLDQPELEKRATDTGLDYVDLDGEICLMVGGAGLHLCVLDAVAAFDSTPANFLDAGDTGCGIGDAKAYAGARILQDRSMRDPAVRSRLIVFSLGVAGAVEAAVGIARAMDDMANDAVPTFAVIHGAGADEGRDILQRHRVAVAPDIRTAVEWAASAERLPAAGPPRDRSEGES